MPMSPQRLLAHCINPQATVEMIFDLVAKNRKINLSAAPGCQPHESGPQNGKYGGNEAPFPVDVHV